MKSIPILLATFLLTLFGLQLVYSKPKTDQEDAATMVKEAKQILDAVKTGLEQPSFTLESLVTIASSFGPKAALLGSSLSVLLALFKQQKVDNTLKNGFAEVNSRLSRMEDKIDQMGDVLANELTLKTLKDLAGPIGLGYLLREYVEYTSATTHNEKKRKDVLTLCEKQQEKSDPERLLNFVQASLNAKSLTQENVLRAIYDKANFDQSVLTAWYKCVVGEYVVATAMQQVCEHLQGRSKDELATSAKDAGDKLVLIAIKMTEYKQLLQTEFAKKVLEDEIKRQIENYSKKIWDRGLANHVNDFLQRKYPFAYWAVQVGQKDGKRVSEAEHRIYHTQVVNKTYAKFFDHAEGSVMVNWAYRSEHNRLLAKNQAPFRQTMGEEVVKAKGSTKTWYTYCKPVLEIVSASTFVKDNYISFVFNKRLYSRRHEPDNVSDPFFAGDALIIDCAGKSDDQWHITCYDSDASGSEMYSEYCYGIF